MSSRRVDSYTGRMETDNRSNSKAAEQTVGYQRKLGNR